MSIFAEFLFLPFQFTLNTLPYKIDMVCLRLQDSNFKGYFWDIIPSPDPT